MRLSGGPASKPCAQVKRCAKSTKSSREIKREIIESRGLVIKTNNLTNALSADIKSIAKRQQTYERRLSWNSAVAYVVFVLVVVRGAQVRVGRAGRRDRSRTEQKTARRNERLRKEAREAQQRDEDRARGEPKAAQFYDLIRQGKRVELVEQFDALKKEPLSKAERAMFSRRGRQGEERAGGAVVPAGAGQGARAAVAGGGDGVRGVAQVQGGLHDLAHGAPRARRRLPAPRAQKEAIPILARSSSGRPIAKCMDDALYQLAFCQMEIQAWNDAKNTWRQLIRRFPDSHYTPEAKLALQTLMQNH